VEREGASLRHKCDYVAMYRGRMNALKRMDEMGGTLRIKTIDDFG